MKRGPFSDLPGHMRQPWNPWHDRRYKPMKRSSRGLAGRPAIFKRAYLEARALMNMRSNLLSEALKDRKP